MSDDYRTDQWILDLFEDWFDPCPFKYVSNGLKIDWEDRTYVNPPYSNPLPWVQKAIEESKLGKRIVMLLKHDSSTYWYRLLHEHGCHFLMVQGRLKHQTHYSAPFPSILVVFP